MDPPGCPGGSVGVGTWGILRGVLGGDRQGGDLGDPPGRRGGIWGILRGVLGSPLGPSGGSQESPQATVMPRSVPRGAPSAVGRASARAMQVGGWVLTCTSRVRRGRPSRVCG